MVSTIFAQQFEFRDPGRFGIYSTAGSTYLTATGVVALLAVLVIIAISDCRRGVLAALALLMLVPDGQRLVIAGVDFAFMRIVGLALIARVMLATEGKWRPCVVFDSLVIFLWIWPVVCQVVRGSGSIMNAIGQGGDAVVFYWVGRACLSGPKDLVAVSRGMISMAAIVSVCFLWERLTHRNPFAMLGGVPPVTAIRDGKLRVQGAFSHPILAGVWWATWLPIFMSLIPRTSINKSRVWAVVGCILATFCVLLSNSSTPYSGVLVACLAWSLYAYRMKLRPLWVAVVALGLSYHLLSSKGLHHLLMARFSLVSGSTGYHRYRLIDAAIDHVREWIAFGGSSTYHWGWGLDDVTCQYVAQSLAGGGLQLGMFVLLIVGVFFRIGRTLRMQRADCDPILFGLGVSLLVHSTCFLAVTYFGQIQALFWIVIGSSVSMTAIREPRVLADGPVRDLGEEALLAVK